MQTVQFTVIFQILGIYGGRETKNSTLFCFPNGLIRTESFSVIYYILELEKNLNQFLKLGKFHQEYIFNLTAA